VPSVPKKILIVGGVAAGMKTASRLRRIDSNAAITVFERSDVVSYGACSLPYYVEGLFEDLDEVRMTPAGTLRDTEFFRKVKGIKVETGCEAVEIDRAAKRLRVRRVTTDLDEWHDYDALVLATGNRPIIPPLPGIGLAGIHTLKTMTDAAALNDAASSGGRAVVIGGGLIGLEMAEALVARGLDVTLVEMKDQILASALDYSMAVLVQREMKKNGVILRLGEAVQRFEGEGGCVRRVVTSGGSYDADLVVMAIGVRPEVTLAEEAGVELGPTGAISVNERQQTSDPSIYAAGDCAEVTDRLTGRKVYVPLGSTANKHGRIAADNIVGRNAAFPGVLGTLIVKVFKLTVARTGLSWEDARLTGFDPVSILAPGPDRVHNYPGVAPIVTRLIADRGSRRLLGAQIVGPGNVDKRIDTLVAAISMWATVDQLADFDLAYAPPYASAIDPLIQAANTLRNKLDGLAFSFDPMEVVEMRRSGRDFIFLDVRSPAEYREIRIPDSRLLPLGALREKLDELPKEKLIVPFCKVSLRGYEAQRILTAAGFTDVRFMEGGILGWPDELDAGL